MANFPTLQQLFNTFLAKFESVLGQSIPLNNKAFLRIDAGNQAIIGQLIQREVVINKKECLAISASRAGLILIGNEYEIPIKDEVSAVFTATLPAATGVEIPALTNFVGDDNGVLYFTQEPFTSVADVVTLSLTSRDPGAIGNLEVGQTMTMAVNIAGAETVATITVVDTVGADAEDTDVYRRRVLDKERAPGGGGNVADYRNWAGMQEGVTRAFPYSGLPHDDPGFPGAPPQRVVYVQADVSIDPDGIPSQSLLDDTRETIITSPITEQHQEPIGLTQFLLFVEPIRRTEIYIQISGSVFIAGTEADVKAKITAAADEHLRALVPFLQGTDIEADKNDLITSGTLGIPVQDVLTANGASMTVLAFGLVPGSFLPSKNLGQGELVKLGDINYL